MPTPRDSHIDQAMTAISVAYKNPRNAYIYDQVFPTVNVTNKTDKYFVFGTGDFCIA